MFAPGPFGSGKAWFLTMAYEPNDRQPNRKPLDEEMSNELEVLRIMEKYRGESTQGVIPEVPASAAAGGTPPAAAPATDGTVVKRNPWRVILAAILGMIPKKGDAPLEIVRKCVFIVALITLIGSLGYILNDMVINPLATKSVYSGLETIHDDPKSVERIPKDDKTVYPAGIRDSMKYFYYLNNEFRGWLTYNSEGSDFLRINYPVMYSGDNEKYLKKDFHNTNNKHGALFFDERNRVETPSDTNKSLIIYGHNMGSGYMFAGLNRFIHDVSYARKATHFHLETLFDEAEYKVFAAIVVNNDKADGPRFGYLRTEFSDGNDFLGFIDQVRARSLYDYPVDVEADDEIVVLSTCTVKSAVHFDDGRLAVFARKVRDGESTSVNTRLIIDNDDVIMPYAWYTNQKLDPHRYYTDTGYTIPTYHTPTGEGTEPAPTMGVGTTTNGTTTGGTTGTGTRPGTTAATTSGTATKPVTTTSGQKPPTSKPPAGVTTTTTTSAAVTTTTTSATPETTTTTSAPEETTTTQAVPTEATEPEAPVSEPETPPAE